MNDAYYSLCQRHFGKTLSVNAWQTKLFADFPVESPYHQKCVNGLYNVEAEAVEDLLIKIRDDKVEGDIVEFGIFEGAWINTLYALMKKAELKRKIWGFDSFKGLSAPSENDTSFWKEGMYSCSLAQVSENVKLKERPEITLVEGYFSESLKSPEAERLGKVAYARIDCDIYEPARECLDFLTDRLSDGSILVFDDWIDNADYGETKALFEWLENVPWIKLNYLFRGVWDHVYFRVQFVNK